MNPLVRATLIPLTLATLGACVARPVGGGAVCEGITLNQIPATGGAHLSTCEALNCGNEVNPPTGGPHCDDQLACRVYTTEQSRCKWVHNLEHGHAVLAYNCPAGCPEVVEALQAIRDELPVSANGARRIILIPDAKLPSRVAAIVWGWSYVSDNVDVAAIRCLLSYQDVDAPEAFLSCAP